MRGAELSGFARDGSLKSSPSRSTSTSGKGRAADMASDTGVTTPSSDPDGVYHLRLYVAGQSPKSVRAVENLRRVCEDYLPGRYTIELVDLVENPQLARGDEIIAVPALVRKLPEPIRRIIGDLSDTEKLLVGLQLEQDRIDP